MGMMDISSPQVNGILKRQDYSQHNKNFDGRIKYHQIKGRDN